MQELIEAFKHEMLKQLQEDLKRSEKWKLEDGVFREVLTSLSNSSPYDIVLNNYTQEYIFYVLKKSIFFNVNKYNFRVYLFFEDVGMPESTPGHAALWCHDTRTLSMNLYDIVDKKLKDKISDNLYMAKIETLSLLCSTECVALIHHEIAHKMFGERLKDISKIPNLRNHSEYNSVLSELYHYMVKRLNLDTNNVEIIEKFLDDLSRSNEQLDSHLWRRISKLDRDKLIKHIQRFIRG